MHCKHCNEEFEPGFEVCWNCGADMDGNTPQEFIRPEDQPEDLEGFVKALNFMGLITGTFWIRVKRDSKPWMTGDFVLPSWAVPAIVGVILCIVSAVISNWTLAWIGIGAVACGSMLFLFRKLL